MRLALLENVGRVGARIPARRREERDVSPSASRLAQPRARHDSSSMCWPNSPTRACFADRPTSWRSSSRGCRSKDRPSRSCSPGWSTGVCRAERRPFWRIVEPHGRPDIHQQQRRQPAFISSMNWGEIVEQLRLVEELLRGDPAGPIVAGLPHARPLPACRRGDTRPAVATVSWR